LERVTFCPICGSESPARSSRCSGCGAPLGLPRKRRLLLWILLVAVAIAGATMCLVG